MGSHGLNAEELPDRRAEHGVTVPHLSIITATKFVINTIVNIITWEEAYELLKMTSRKK